MTKTDNQKDLNRFPPYDFHRRFKQAQLVFNQLRKKAVQNIVKISTLNSDPQKLLQTLQNLVKTHASSNCFNKLVESVIDAQVDVKTIKQKGTFQIQSEIKTQKETHQPQTNQKPNQAELQQELNKEKVEIDEKNKDITQNNKQKITQSQKPEIAEHAIQKNQDQNINNELPINDTETQNLIQEKEKNIEELKQNKDQSTIQKLQPQLQQKEDAIESQKISQKNQNNVQTEDQSKNKVESSISTNIDESKNQIKIDNATNKAQLEEKPDIKDILEQSVKNDNAEMSTNADKKSKKKNKKNKKN